MSNKGFEECKRQFGLNNKFKLGVTMFLQMIVAVANISLAFFIILIVGAMEQKDMKMFLRSMMFMALVVVVYLVASVLDRKSVV